MALYACANFFFLSKLPPPIHPFPIPSRSTILPRPYPCPFLINSDMGMSSGVYSSLLQLQPTNNIWCHETPLGSLHSLPPMGEWLRASRDPDPGSMTCIPITYLLGYSAQRTTPVGIFQHIQRPHRLSAFRQILSHPRCQHFRVLWGGHQWSGKLSTLGFKPYVIYMQHSHIIYA